MKLKSKNILFFALQVLLGSVFIFSGCVKLISLNAFYEALINFNLFNGSFLVLLKYFIPIAEVLIGFFIIFNFSSSIPSLLASFILSLFTSLIVAKIFSVLIVLFGFYELSYRNEIFAQSKRNCCNNGQCAEANCLRSSSINAGSDCSIHYILTCKDCIDLEYSGCLTNCQIYKNIFCMDNGKKYFGKKVLCEENK